MAGCDPIYLIEPTEEETATVHEGVITADETWREDDSPHKVFGDLVVAGPDAPTLTIEPGVRVLFDRRASLSIGTATEPGALHAVGTPSDGIEFMAELQFRSRGYWGVIHFGPGAAPSRLEHVAIMDCGETAEAPPACLRVIGSASGPTLRDVGIFFSSGYGFASVGGGFGPDSRNLTIRFARDSPIRITPNDIGSVPSGLHFGNDDRAVIEVGGGRVSTSQLWSDRGVPYVVSGPITVSGSDSPSLQVSAGTELLFGRSGEIVVGGESGPGTLRATGTEEAPIVFSTGARQPGGWNGITFRANASPESLLDQTVVEFAGASNGFSKANITFFSDIGPAVRNSIIRGSDGCGVAQLRFDGVWTTDLTDPSLGNQFSDNAFSAQCTQQ